MSSGESDDFDVDGGYDGDSRQVCDGENKRSGTVGLGEGRLGTAGLGSGRSSTAGLGKGRLGTVRLSTMRLGPERLCAAGLSSVYRGTARYAMVSPKKTIGVTRLNSSQTRRLGILELDVLIYSR